VLDDSPVLAEAEQRDTCDRLGVTRGAGDDRPVLDRGPVTVDHRLAIAEVDVDLVGECPGGVLTRRLRLSERVRDESGVIRVQRGDAIGVTLRPGARPTLHPSPRGGTTVYFATSIARLSRMTITFT
jgi:hypothetical protein